MPDQKYEIEPIVQYGYYWFHAQVKVLTGLEYDEIDRVFKTNEFTGQGVIQLFRDLGYNVTPRWKKFDPNTEYPAMIRCRSLTDKSHWFPFVYYDGKVYAPNQSDGIYNSIDEFLDNCRDLKITSMIQVWI